MKFILTDVGNVVHCVQDSEASESQINDGLKSESINQEIADLYDASDETMFFTNGNLMTTEEYCRQVPFSVTNYQIKRALNTNPADRAAVEALVDGADQDTKDGWFHAQEFVSDHALFVGAVEVLGWSQQKVDDYLILAKTFV